MTSKSNDRGAAGDPSFVYRDLRRRNERHADVARLLEARRLRHIERVIQVIRDRRFGRGG
jgi:hypothetical protein